MPGLLRKLSIRDIGGASSPLSRGQACHCEGPRLAGNQSRGLIFFVLFYLYLWLGVDLRLIYGCTEVITNFPVFYKGWVFFSDFLSRPGGLVEYTGAFLSQFFYIGWAGALVVTIQAWLMSVCIGCILKAVNLSHLRWLRFIPPILLLITYTQYTYHFITTLAFLVVLVFVYLYLRITHSLTSNTGRLIVGLVLSVILYTMAAARIALTESLEGLGERPIILKRLALINMAKANYDSARIYLGALSKTLFYDDWANNYLERLKSDPDLSQDKQIQRLRSVCMEKDYDFTALNIETMLLHLLEKNRKNRMAFEYLMSWYLLTGQLEKFVQNLDRLDDFGFSQFPRLYEDAMLVYVNITGKPVNLRGRLLSTESRQRFDGFNQVLNDYGKNKQAAFNTLAKDYWDSYFFYYVYGRQRAEK